MRISIDWQINSTPTLSFVYNDKYNNAPRTIETFKRLKKTHLKTQNNNYCRRYKILFTVGYERQIEIVDSQYVCKSFD